MKKIIISALISLPLICTTVSCTNIADGTGDGPYKQNGDNGVYMGNADESGYVEVSMPIGKGGFTTITPRIAAPVDRDIVVKVIADPTAVAENTKAAGIKAKGVPAKEVVFIDAKGKEHKGEITVTIPKGSVAAPITCGVHALDAETYSFKEKWAIGARIVSVEGDVPMLSTPQTTVIRLNREVRIVTSVAQVTLGGYGLGVLSNEPFTKEWEEWTIQMSVYFTFLSHDNITTGYFINPMEGGSMYTRIKDATGVQIKSLHEKENSWTNKPLKTREWINISYVYKRSGNGGIVQVYVDNELQNELATSRISFGLNSKETGWAIGNSNWTGNYLREVRFWNRALTETEIKENLELPMDLETEGLVMYMPCTKEYFDAEKGVPTVAKGNWRVVKREPESAKTTISIVENVVFPNKTLVKEESK